MDRPKVSFSKYAIAIYHDMESPKGNARDVSGFGCSAIASSIVHALPSPAPVSGLLPCGCAVLGAAALPAFPRALSATPPCCWSRCRPYRLALARSAFLGLWLRPAVVPVACRSRLVPSPSVQFCFALLLRLFFFPSPRLRLPVPMLFSVVDDRSGAAYQEYRCVYGEDVVSGQRVLFNAMAPKNDDRVISRWKGLKPSSPDSVKWPLGGIHGP